MVLCLVSHWSAVWLPSSYNNFPVTLGSGFQVPLAAAVTLVVIYWFPGQDWGTVILYKPSTGTGYLQRQKTWLKEL